MTVEEWYTPIWTRGNPFAPSEIGLGAPNSARAVVGSIRLVVSMHETHIEVWTGDEWMRCVLPEPTP